MFSLAAAWHGGAALGLQWKDTISTLSTENLHWSCNVGYRFFLGKSRWFIDPTIIFILPQEAQLHIGAQIGRRLSLYGIGGGHFCPHGIGYVWGLGSSYEFRSHESFTMSLTSRRHIKVFSAGNKNPIFKFLIGVEWHQSNYHKL